MKPSISQILCSWDIPQDLPVREISESDGVHYFGHVWFVGDLYVLKKHPKEDRQNGLMNFPILAALEAQGLAAAPLRTKGGAEFVDCGESDSFYTLTRYVSGKILTAEEISGNRMPEYGHKIGQALAKLHMVLASIDDSASAKNADMYKSVTEWAILKTKEANAEFDMGLDESLFDDYIETFGKLYSQLPKQLIHRDAHPGNIIFNDGKVSAFIDFNFATGERNIRLRDVCYCLTGLGSNFYNNPERWIDVVEQMLAGYNSVDKLTKEEKQSVFYVMCSIQFTCVAYFNKNDKFKQALEENLRLTPFIANLKDRIVAVSV